MVRSGAAHQEIVDLATDERADLVIMGTHGRSGLTRVLLGSVAERVIRFAPCPVLTARKPD
jgi:universal stress protein A